MGTGTLFGIIDELASVKNNVIAFIADEFGARFESVGFSIDKQPSTKHIKWEPQKNVMVMSGCIASKIDATATGLKVASRVENRHLNARPGGDRARGRPSVRNARGGVTKFNLCAQHHHHSQSQSLRQ